MKHQLIDENILDDAIKAFGIEAQLEMVIEECLELALAIQKLKRIRGGTKEEKRKAVIDEIADVTIMVRQATFIFGTDAVNDRIIFKMKRLEERIKEKII